MQATILHSSRIAGENSVDFVPEELFRRYLFFFVDIIVSASANHFDIDVNKIDAKFYHKFFMIHFLSKYCKY